MIISKASSRYSPSLKQLNLSCSAISQSPSRT